MGVGGVLYWVIIIIDGFYRFEINISFDELYGFLGVGSWWE
jgi:hypothetical protein